MHQRRNVAADVVQTLRQLPTWLLGGFPSVSGLLPFCRTDAMGAESGGTMRVIA